MLKAIYGHHNLTSDTEPEEVLIVSKKRVMTELCRAVNLQNDNEEDWIRAGEEIEFTLTQLFGDKCLPGKEPMKIEATDNLIAMAKDEMNVKQPTPKFSKGDKVVYKGEVYTVEAVTNMRTYYLYSIDTGDDHLCALLGSALEPYTEEKETMEEKELNLCELLKDCEGEGFYSPAFGNIQLEENEENNLVFREDYNKAVDELIQTDREGVHSFNGMTIIYPSRALYEKYPLDAYSAWMEWKEARKPKIWRAERGSKYWWFNDEFEIRCNADIRDSIDNNRADFGNYFRTEEVAKQAAGIVKDALQKFHEQHEKN